MTPEILACLREAGSVASAARARGEREIVAGARVAEVCQAVEDEIVRLGARPAFPTQSSRNHVAAHWCPGWDDPLCYADGDLAKLDIGVHVDGWVVDTALTVNVGGRPELQKLVDAARAALEAAIAAVVPGVPVRHLSTVIERTITSYGLRPMQNLCGHGVSRWTVHCPPAIPNSPDGADHRLDTHSVVAIEPFATDGRGQVAEEGPAEVFRVVGAPSTEDGMDGAVLRDLRDLNGLPFSRRQLGAHPRDVVDATLERLRQKGLLRGYPPLVERSGRPVAQAEHTVYVGPLGVEVLTR